MDLNALEGRLRAALKDLFLEGSRAHETGRVIEGYDRRMERLRKLHGRVRSRLTRSAISAKWEAFKAEQRSLLQEVRDRRDRGELIMCFDIERSLSGYTTEIGITTMKYDRLETLNIRRHDVIKPTPYVFGHTVHAHEHEMFFMLRSIADMSTMYIGHSMREDFRHLETRGAILPDRPLLDTAFYSRILPENLDPACMLQLSQMCAIFGIDASHPHCGGNDSRYNMELVCALLRS